MVNLSTISYRNSLKKKSGEHFLLDVKQTKKPVYKDRLNNKDEKKLKALSPINF